jgi:hypothetical protein
MPVERIGSELFGLVFIIEDLDRALAPLLVQSLKLPSGIGVLGLCAEPLEIGRVLEILDQHA